MIYMTTDEWNEISKLIEENDFYKLAEEIASRTYDLDISKQELDKIIKDYATKEKRLWKAKSFCIYQNMPIPCSTFNTDVMELTEAEAESWYRNWVKHLNDGHDDGFTLYSGGLFYKKDGEWIRYLVDV